MYCKRLIMRISVVTQLLLSSVGAFAAPDTLFVNSTSSSVAVVELECGKEYVVYDDGGSTGNYHNSSSWLLSRSTYLRLHAPEGSTLLVDGYYSLEPSFWTATDVLRFFSTTHAIASNNSSNANFLAEYHGGLAPRTGMGVVSLQTPSNELTVTFVANNSGNSDGFEFRIRVCCQGTDEIEDVSISDVTDNAAFVTWNDSSPATQWTVCYGTNESYLPLMEVVDSKSVNLSGLMDNATYYVKIYNNANSTMNSGYCGTRFSTFRTLPKDEQVGCFDFAALHSANVKAEYGSYASGADVVPTMTDGVVDYGYHDIRSRHTVNYECEYDPRTGNVLRTIPEGGTVSVRLGNWNNNRETESITYKYNVDTASNDLLILRYAAVLQDPRHSESAQPQFSFDIVDENGESIDDVCNSAVFTAGNVSDWNMFETESEVVQWKDWSAVGINLAPFDGQTIYVKLTTRDCKESYHYGYAYFTLECENKVITSDGCGENIDNIYSAPEGFDYEWFRESDPDVVLSTERSCHITEEGVYKCVLKMIGRTSDCSDTLTVNATRRYPLAQFDYEMVDTDRCDVHVQMKNSSVVTTENHNIASSTGEPCESYVWIVDGEDVSHDKNPVVSLYAGDHVVQLVAILACGECRDTISQIIHVELPECGDVIDTVVCEGVFRFRGQNFTESGTYDVNVGGRTVTIHLVMAHFTDEGSFSQIVFEDDLPYSWMGNVFDGPCCIVDTVRNESLAECQVRTLELFLVPQNTELCTVEPIPSDVFDPVLAWSSEAEMSPYVIPLVGDLNGDGHPEIVCFDYAGQLGESGSTTETRPAVGSKLAIYDGVTKQRVLEMGTNSLKFSASHSKYPNKAAFADIFGSCPYGILRTKYLDTDIDTGLIVVATRYNATFSSLSEIHSDYYLQAYDIHGNNIWSSSVPYGRDRDNGLSGSPRSTREYPVTVSFADFNNDGHPEVYVRDKIYDAATGVLLAEAPEGSNEGDSWSHKSGNTNNNGKLSAPFAANLLGDERLELVSGNEVYGVDIANRNGVTGNSITLLKRLELPSDVPVEDGHSQVADFNMDGHLDVLVTTRSGFDANATVIGYVWDVYNDEIVGSFSIGTNKTGKSIPLIADIDNDGVLEVVIQTGNSTTAHRVQAFDYDVASGAFEEKWALSADDDSYSNTLSMFDFNGDGKSELLLSGRTSFRVISGDDGAVIQSLAHGEVTVMDYPIIADVDNDGSAEIITIDSATANPQIAGHIHIFRSGSRPWMSARPTWNQYMFNGADVNGDLSIPRFAYSNAAQFDNPQQTSMVRRPYNNFLAQSGLVDSLGRPVQVAADLVLDTCSKPYYNVTSFKIELSFCNRGSVNVNPGFGIALYDAGYRGEPLDTFFVNRRLEVGECIDTTLYIPLSRLCSMVSDTFVVALNDNGAGIAQNGSVEQQPECDTLNNLFKVPFPKGGILEKDTVVECDAVFPIVWNDFVFYSTGIIYDTLDIPAYNGCDSVVTLVLRKFDDCVQDTQYVVSICDAYTWIDGVTYYESTQSPYPQYLITGSGVDPDTMASLRLIVRHSSDTVLYKSVRETDLPVFWNGNWYTEAGTYSDTLPEPNAEGCDSIKRMTLEVFSDYLLDCALPAEPSDWSTPVLKWSSEEDLSTYTIPLVGDLDGDGQPEIVCFDAEGKNVFEVSQGHGASSKIAVFKRSGNTWNRQPMAEPVLKDHSGNKVYADEFSAAPYGILRAKVWNATLAEERDTGLIVVATRRSNTKYSGSGNTYYLQAYNMAGENVWTSSTYYGRDVSQYMREIPATISFADFNGDGYPEIYVRNKIFDAATGQLLVEVDAEDGNEGNAWSHKCGSTNYYQILSAPFAADMVGDSRLELILGNQMYDVDITNRNGTAGNNATLVATHTPPSGVSNDGNTQVADFNNDGNLDVLLTVRSLYNNTYVYIYVWDVANDVVSNSYRIPVNTGGKSIPLIADIDNDGLLEVVIQAPATSSSDRIQSLKFDPSSNSFSRMWTLPHNEDSWSNTFTMFDFNGDGEQELLISGRNWIRVVGADGSVKNSLSFGEVTIMDYPVIADVDNDGSAEFVTIDAFGSPSGSPSMTGKLHIFKSGGTPWMAARPVWNQYMYNVTCVNNDLTIPRHPLDNARSFVDPEDSTIVRRPFNAFLAQATFYDQNGSPVRPVADIVADFASSPYYSAGLMMVPIHFCNIGAAEVQSGFGISVYDSVYRGAPIDTFLVEENLPVNGCLDYVLRIPMSRLCGLTSDSIVVALNDKGSGIAQNGLSVVQQAECDTLNNLFAVHFEKGGTFVKDTLLECGTLFPFVWNDIQFDHPGTIQDTLVGMAHDGCDSIVALTLNMPLCDYDSVDSYVVCDSMVWHLDARNYTQSTSEPYPHVVLRGATSSDPDTVVYLHLTVNYGTRDAVCQTSCISYTWYGQTYTQSDTCIHSYENEDGCISVDTLYLTINPGTHEVGTATSCDNYEWRGSAYTESGTYTYDYSNDEGCASTDTLHLTIHHGTHDTTIAATCESYLWRGSAYTESSTYTYDYSNDEGCASTDTLHLMVGHHSYSTLYQSIPENELPYVWNGITFDRPDSLQTIIPNAANCDSVITMVLSVLYNLTNVIDSTICDSQLPLIWNGMSFVDAGEQTLVLTASNGADSIIQMNLTVNPSYSLDEYMTVCEDILPYIWNGVEISSSSIQQYHTSTILGCDSVVTLHLTVSPTYDVVKYDTICEGTSYLYHGTEYGEMGRYVVSYQTIQGCDSVSELDLYVLTHPAISIIDDYSCVTYEHILTASTDVPYHRWTAYPDDDILIGREEDSTIVIRPTREMELTFYADYAEPPKCPSSQSVIIRPIRNVSAAIGCRPAFLTQEEPILHAWDNSAEIQTENGILMIHIFMTVPNLGMLRRQVQIR